MVRVADTFDDGDDLDCNSDLDPMNSSHENTPQLISSDEAAEATADEIYHHDDYDDWEVHFFLTFKFYYQF